MCDANSDLLGKIVVLFTQEIEDSMKPNNGEQL